MTNSQPRTRVTSALAFVAVGLCLVAALGWNQRGSDTLVVSGFVEADHIRLGARIGGRIRTRLLYNPDLESSRPFGHGLVEIILQLVTLFLTAFAVVFERELGTLEQRCVTPVGRAGLVLGKLVPYAIVGVAATLIVLCVMVFLFAVPIEGSLALLLLLSGLFVSTVSRTQLQATQCAFLRLRVTRFRKQLD